MRTRFRYDADLDAVVEIRDNYFEERPEGPAVITDSLGTIHGLLNHADGRVYDGKRAFEKATHRAGAVTVGNESIPQHVKPVELIGRREIGETVKRAYEELSSGKREALDRHNRTQERY